MHAGDPITLLYVPIAQTAHVGDPVALLYAPGGQGVHADDPVTLVYAPIAQGVHVGDAVADANVPIAHGVHTAAPAAEYSPGRHGTAVPFTLPTAQAYPAGHGPLHTELFKPSTPPNTPPGQALHALATATAL